MKSRHRQELLGGLTLFMSVSYIVLLNPAILSAGGQGMPATGVMTATVLLCFSMTLAMGWIADLPFAVAPGLGINAFFIYGLVLGQGIPWPTALGLVFLSGVLFVLASATQFRELVLQAIPHHLRLALGGGIGLFLAFVGLKGAGLIEGHPETLVTFKGLNGQSLLALTGFGLLVFLRSKGRHEAFLACIAFVSISALGLGWVAMPQRVFAMPDFHSVLGKMDVVSALKLSLLPTAFALFFTDLFDSISTFVTVSQSTGLVDENGEPKNLRKGLFVDALATLVAGPLGTSSGTAYLESAAGIQAGGRTGWTAIYAALFFLPCLFISPLLGVVPTIATAPILIWVGFAMFRSSLSLDVQRLENALPAFLVIALVPMTFSITQGLLWGFVSHVLMYAMVGRRKEITSMGWFLALCSALLLALES